MYSDADRRDPPGLGDADDSPVAGFVEDEGSWVVFPDPVGLSTTMT